MQGLWQITVMTDDAPVALEAGIETRLDISTISISKNSGRFMLQAWSEEMPDEAVLNSIIRQIYSTAETVEYHDLREAFVRLLPLPALLQKTGHL